MNERIKQLVEQCYHRYSEHHIDLEKFAELIVRECLEMMGQAEDDAYHCFEPSERPTEYIEWLRDWQERFTKHFGVE